MRDKNATLQITTGAMFIAIFAIMLIINRYTGSMFEELILYIMPIPMVAYSAKFGWKSGVPVMVAMALISFFFGTLLTIFYAITEAFIGLVFGTCVYHKVEATKTLFTVMVLSVIANVTNTIVLASLFGYNIADEITEMQTMMDTALAGTGLMEVAGVETMLSSTSLFRILVLSMICLGLVQGIIIYYLSLLILNRLHFQVEKPKSLYEFLPPTWTRWIAAALTLIYMMTYAYLQNDERLQGIIMTAGMCGYLYLTVFGVIGATILIRTYITPSKGMAAVIAMFGYVAFSQIMVVLGFFYLSRSYHDKWLAKLRENDEFNRKVREMNQKKLAEQRAKRFPQYDNSTGESGDEK